MLANAGAKPGDALILTKPLGLGIISTAAKNDQDAKGAITEAIRVMTTLNRAAAEVLTRFEVHALTDITGFGLLGHLRNVTAASGVTAEVWADRVPVLRGRARVREGRDRARRDAGEREVPRRLGRVRLGRVAGGATAAVRRADVRRVARRGAASASRGGGRVR